MREHTTNLCDQLDAALFTGDEFHDAQARAELQAFMLRWEERLLDIASESGEEHSDGFHAVAYLASGGTICPKCGTTAIEGYSIEAGSGGASQKMGCLSCECTWTDTYTLTNVTEG